MQHATLPLHLLDGHKRNYRSHPPEQIGMIKASLARFGAVRSIVVAPEANGRYTILAGHGVVEAAREKGITELACDVAPESWDAAMRDAYLVADNNLAQHASDDESILATLLSEQQNAGFDLAALGSDDETLRQMLETLGDGYAGEEEEGDGGDDFDTTPEEGPTRTQVGDIWQLGKHRLLVGDSTKQVDVERLMGNNLADLMWTDPPYHVGKDFGAYDEGNEWDALMQSAWLGCAHSVLKPEAQRYICFAPARSRDAIALYEPKRLLVWCKPFALMRSNSWDWAYEFVAWCYDTEKPKYFEKPEGTLSYDWQEIPSVIHGHEGRYHITQKPLALLSRHIQASCPEKGLIYEPFLGSGTTIVSAERLGRCVAGIEIDCKNCDVILRRYEAETGHTATLLTRIEEAVHV